MFVREPRSGKAVVLAEMPPLISVIIPTRHRNDLLARCLDRLAPGAQSMPAEQYEVIVTDDGSSSDARQMLNDRYPWAIWNKGPCRGPAANRNSGAARARADYLAFVDDDCVPSAAWLDAYRAATQPGISVYEGKTTCAAGVASPIYHAPVNLTGGCLWSCNMMIERAQFSALGGFDEDYPRPHMEDADFRERLARSGARTAWVPEALVDHPPRLVPLYGRLAMNHECEIIYQLKHGQKPRLHRLLFHSMRARAQTLRSYPLSRDWLTFAFSTAVEAAWLVAKFGSWSRRHARLAR